MIREANKINLSFPELSILSKVHKDAEDWIFASANRAVMGEDRVSNTRCIASGCMAWRQIDRPGSTEPVGFCGAFGRPAGA